MADEPKTEAKTANGAEVADIVVVLRKPIMAHGDEIKELKFREPTAADIEACGNPVSIDFSSGKPKMVFNERQMSAMMAQLAAIPPSSIRLMGTRDWNTAAWELASFFMPDL